MKEKWRWVKGWREYYKVSTHGRVRSAPRVIWRKSKNGLVRMFFKGRILRQHLNDMGYYTVNFSRNGVVCHKKIHQLVAKTFVPNPHNKPEVNHEDANPKNNHVSNLTWMTRQEQVDHAMKLGNVRSGERHGMSKLSHDDVRLIKKLIEKKITQRQIAQKFGVHSTTICNINRGKHYIHA